MKKFCTVLTVLFLAVTLLGCSNKIFMANYSSPASESEYRAFFSGYSTDTDFPWAHALLKYKIKGAFSISTLQETVTYDVDLDVDVKNSSIKGKSTAVRTSFSGVFEKTVIYQPKNGGVAKTVNGVETCCSERLSAILSLIEVPEEGVNLYNALLKNLLNAPISDAEISKQGKNGACHVKMTEQTSSKLIYGGVTPESSDGDVYLCFNANYGGLYAARLVFKTTLGADYYQSGDIVFGTNFFTSVDYDIQIYPV